MLAGLISTGCGNGGSTTIIKRTTTVTRSEEPSTTTSTSAASQDLAKGHFSSEATPTSAASRSGGGVFSLLGEPGSDLAGDGLPGFEVAAGGPHHQRDDILLSVDLDSTHLAQ